jgi:hypothetical protein
MKPVKEVDIQGESVGAFTGMKTKPTGPIVTDPRYLVSKNRLSVFRGWHSKSIIYATCKPTDYRVFVFFVRSIGTYRCGFPLIREESPPPTEIVMGSLLSTVTYADLFLNDIENSALMQSVYFKYRPDALAT